MPSATRLSKIERLTPDEIAFFDLGYPGQDWRDGLARMDEASFQTAMLLAQGTQHRVVVGPDPRVPRLTGPIKAEGLRQTLATWHPEVRNLQRRDETVTFTYPGRTKGWHELEKTVGYEAGQIEHVPAPRRPLPQPFRIPKGASAAPPTPPAKYITTIESMPGAAGPPDGVYVVELYWPLRRERSAKLYVARRRAKGIDTRASWTAVGVPIPAHRRSV